MTHQRRSREQLFHPQTKSEEKEFKRKVKERETQPEKC
jgi:hypothetical protein